MILDLKFKDFPWTKAKLYKELNHVDQPHDKRLQYTNFFIDNPELIIMLSEILFDVNNEILYRAP
jgi:hypothetical protein